MKTKLIKTAALLSFSIALSNCGGSSGSSSKAFVSLNPDQIQFVNPPEGQITANFCRYGDYVIDVDGSACNDYAANPNDWLTLRRSNDTSGASIQLTKGVADQSSNGCRISGIRPVSALVEGQEHTLAFTQGPGGTPAQQKFTKFISSFRADDSTVCGASNFSATGISPGTTMTATNIDTFGTQDAQGNWSFDWESFASSAAGVNLASLIGSIFGIGSIPNTTNIIIDFNENLDSLYVPNAVALYRLNALSGSCFGITGLGEYINLNGTCSGGSCLAVSNNLLQVKLPNFGGGLDSGCYAVVLARGMKSQSGKYLDKTYFKAYTVQ